MYVLRIDHTSFFILLWRRSLSYRSQCHDLICKSLDWFLYNKNLRPERVNTGMVGVPSALFLKHVGAGICEIRYYEDKDTKINYL